MKVIYKQHTFEIFFVFFSDKELEILTKDNEEIKKIIDDILNLDRNVDEPLKIDEKTEPLLREITEHLENLQKAINNITNNIKKPHNIDMSELVSLPILSFVSVGIVVYVH